MFEFNGSEYYKENIQMGVQERSWVSGGGVFFLLSNKLNSGRNQFMDPLKRD